MAKAPLDAGGRFEQNLLIDAPPARVFECFFDPDALRAWWQVARSVTTPVPLGIYRYHGANKAVTQRDAYRDECVKVLNRYTPIIPSDLKRLNEQVVSKHLKAIGLGQVSQFRALLPKHRIIGVGGIEDTHDILEYAFGAKSDGIQIGTALFFAESKIKFIDDLMEGLEKHL